MPRSDSTLQWNLTYMQWKDAGVGMATTWVFLCGLKPVHGLCVLVQTGGGERCFARVCRVPLSPIITLIALCWTLHQDSLDLHWAGGEPRKHQKPHQSRAVQWAKVQKSGVTTTQASSGFLISKSGSSRMVYPIGSSRHQAHWQDAELSQHVLGHIH